MAYDVVKTVKGKKYLYRQSSYRENGKVKTRSVYLGAVDPRTGELNESAPSPESQSKQKEEKEVITTNTFQEIQSKIDLRSFGISETALNARFTSLRTRLKKKGILPSSLGQITMKHGSEVASKASSNGNQIVTLPRKQKGNGTKFRSEMYKAMGRSTLSAWERGNSDEFRKLSLQFNNSFQRTQKFVSRFVMLGRDRNRLAKTLSLRFWGNMLQLKPNLLDPMRLGIVDESKRQSWKEEAVGIFAAIERTGSEAFFEERKKHYLMARKEHSKALHAYKEMNRFNHKRRKAKRRLERAKFRLACQKELVAKVELVEQLFF